MNITCFYCRELISIPGAPPDLSATEPKPMPPEFHRLHLGDCTCPHCGAIYEIRQIARFGPSKPYKPLRPEGWEPPEAKP